VPSWTLPTPRRNDVLTSIKLSRRAFR
jgi:hypothetical protein